MEQKTLTLKNNLKKIPVDYFKNNLPDLKNTTEAKALVIGKWLAGEIETGFKNKKLLCGQLLPSKAEFAYNLGVSIGTIQNALKYCEDVGCIDAKPCVGTVIKGKKQKGVFNRKTSSKRDKVIFKIKKYLKTKNYKVGDSISSPKEISLSVDEHVNSIRFALESLCSLGIMKHVYKTAESKRGKYLILEDITVEDDAPEIKTLADKTVTELKDYISQNYKRGEKIASHSEFAKILNTSISTIHTAFDVLCKEGILQSRRGQYGTIVIKMPDDAFSQKPEMSIFAPAAEAVSYYYEKVQKQIKKMISEDYEIGDKLPPITEISKNLEISPNTVRKALVKIAEEGYVQSFKGRYGGTVVVDIPQAETQSFRWLAVSPSYANKLK